MTSSTATSGVLDFLGLAHPDNFENFVLVEVLETSTGNDILVVLLSEQETSVAKPLAIEGIRELKDVADVLYRDALCQNVLALLLDRRNVKSVSQLQKKARVKA